MISGNIWKKDTFVNMETTDKIVDIDNNLMDPQFCATIASDIYKHLRDSEVWNISSNEWSYINIAFNFVNFLYITDKHILHIVTFLWCIKVFQAFSKHLLVFFGSLEMTCMLHSRKSLKVAAGQQSCEHFYKIWLNSISILDTDS